MSRGLFVEIGCIAGCIRLWVMLSYLASKYTIHPLWLSTFCYSHTLLAAPIWFFVTTRLVAHTIAHTLLSYQKGFPRPSVPLTSSRVLQPQCIWHNTIYLLISNYKAWREGYLVKYKYPQTKPLWPQTFFYPFLFLLFLFLLLLSPEVNPQPKSHLVQFKRVRLYQLVYLIKS